jgi:predicted extracellular nuclease
MKSLTVSLALLALLAACTRTVDEEEDTWKAQEDAKAGEDGKVAGDGNGKTDDAVEPPEDLFAADGKLLDKGLPGDDGGGQTDQGIFAIQKRKEGLECGADSKFIELAQGVSLAQVVVTAPVHFVDDNLDGFFVQEKGGGPYSGIKITVATGTAPELAVGDVFDVVGDAKEYYCLTELEATKLTKTDQTADPVADVVPAAKLASKNPEAEPYEGGLVRIENVKLASTDNYGGFATEEGVVVDDAVFKDMKPAGVGCVYKSITGVLDYGYSEYKLLPRDAADLVLDESVECGGATEETTIEAIQTDAESATCPPPSAGGKDIVNLETVALSGVVVASPRLDVSKDKLHGYFVYEGQAGPNKGILLVIDWSEDAKYEIGAILDVEGEWKEYYCFTEVQLTSHAKTGVAEGAIPVTDVTTADLAPAAAEKYEGVLVRLSDVEVIEETNKYGEFLVTGNVMISTAFGLDYKPKKGDKIKSVAGPLYYSWDNFKILPRTMDDIVL